MEEEKQIAKKQYCLLISDGVEIWMEEDAAKKISIVLEQSDVKYLPRGDGIRKVNKAFVIGLFDASEMQERTHRKNGQWKCEKNARWHERFKECNCRSPEEKQRMQEQLKQHQDKFGLDHKPLYYNEDENY